MLACAEKREYLWVVTGPGGAKQRFGEAAVVCLPPKDPRRSIWFPATQLSKTKSGLSVEIGAPES